MNLLLVFKLYVLVTKSIFILVTKFKYPTYT